MAICVVCKTNKVGWLHSHTCYFEGDWYEVCSAKCAATAQANNEASEQSTPPPVSSDNSATGLTADNHYRLTEEYDSQISDLKLFGIKLIMVLIVVGIGLHSIEIVSDCSNDVVEGSRSSGYAYEERGACFTSIRFKYEIRRLF